MSAETLKYLVGCGEEFKCVAGFTTTWAGMSPAKSALVQKTKREKKRESSKTAAIKRNPCCTAPKWF